MRAAVRRPDTGPTRRFIMRRLLKEIGDRLQAFVDQRDDVALVLRSAAADSLPVLKILEGLEEASTSDLFWTVTDNFVEPTSYASVVVKNFATRHEVVRLAMQERGMPVWPPIPPQVVSDMTPPVQRLRELAAFSRELLPVPNGGNNVWIFYPLEVADGTAYATLIGELLHHDFPFPWCHHLRFIVRADPDSVAMHTVLGRMPRIQWYQPDLSKDAIERGLEEEAADESLPLAERMGLVPMMAGNDFAMARYPDAMQKYELLLRYHASVGNNAMAALALNGMGEVYERTGDLDRANASYEAALIPASDGDHPPVPVLLNTVVNLGNLCVRQRRWADAESYYDVAQQLATAARNAPAKISALGDRGDCQQQQGKAEDALQSWRDGLVIAAQLQDVDACRTLLGRLEQQYVHLGQHAAAREVYEQRLVLSGAVESAA